MKVGVVLMLEGDAAAGPTYREVRSLAVQAEQAGFDSIWIYDHLLFRNEESTKGQWECFTFLAALAEVTQCVELGTLVACTAFRNPAMLAKIAVTLDEVSDGRFTLGIGAGWNKTEFRAFGLPYDHRVDRFEEALQIIVPLLRAGRVDFAGHYAAARDCEMVPPGPRGGSMPLLIGASGPRMLRLAAQYADNLNTGFDIEDPEQKERRAIEAACVAVGRDPATLPISIPFWAAFPDLGEIPPHMHDSVYRTPEELAAKLQVHDRAGLDHLMFDFRPNSAASLARLSEALRLFRGTTAA
ncbi:MAG: LLM class flavin-dependent oxidoreductase [Chloroflexota bacterium]|nr:LLM class flavin-dependent oxidoreductase [Chloroflexota bacterium]